MQVTAEKLAKLTTEYAGYLEGDKLDASSGSSGSSLRLVTGQRENSLIALTPSDTIAIVQTSATR